MRPHCNGIPRDKDDHPASQVVNRKFSQYVVVTLRWDGDEDGRFRKARSAVQALLGSHRSTTRDHPRTFQVVVVGTNLGNIAGVARHRPQDHLVPSTCEVKGQGTSDVTGTNDSDCRHSAQVPAARQLWTRLEMSCPY